MLKASQHDVILRSEPKLITFVEDEMPAKD